MKNIQIKDVAAFLFVLLFAYTATSKFMDHDRFVFQMRLAPMPLIYNLAPMLGWTMPVLETALVIILSVNKYRLTGLYLSVVLMVLFEVYITVMLLSGQHLPCTCGGIISTITWKEHLFFNAFFIVLGITGIFQSKPIQKSPAKFAGTL